MRLPKIVLPVALSLFASLALAAQQLSLIPIQVADKPLKVEFAHTFEQRQRGLMYRKQLCEDCGMLFDFKQRREVGMWMKNTLIPLDVAFIDEDGTIRTLASMQPKDLSVTSSKRPVRYALEMNLGWFTRHGVKVGDRVIIGAPASGVQP